MNEAAVLKLWATTKGNYISVYTAMKNRVTEREVEFFSLGENQNLSAFNGQLGSGEQILFQRTDESGITLVLLSPSQHHSVRLVPNS